MVPEYPELYQMAGVRGSWQMGRKLLWNSDAHAILLLTAGDSETKSKSIED